MGRNAQRRTQPPPTTLFCPESFQRCWGVGYAQGGQLTPHRGNPVRPGGRGTPASPNGQGWPCASEPWHRSWHLPLQQAGGAARPGLGAPADTRERPSHHSLFAAEKRTQRDTMSQGDVSTLKEASHSSGGSLGIGPENNLIKSVAGEGWLWKEQPAQRRPHSGCCWVREAVSPREGPPPSPLPSRQAGSVPFGRGTRVGGTGTRSRRRNACTTHGVRPLILLQVACLPLLSDQTLPSHLFPRFSSCSEIQINQDHLRGHTFATGQLPRGPLA